MIDKKCLVCGKIFKIFPYREKRAKYCSTRCMGSDDKANWSKTKFKDGHKSFTKPFSNNKASYKWKKWRLEVYKRDNYTCQDCSESNRKKLVPHHIVKWEDDVSLRFDIKNGITLCRGCHLHRHPEILDARSF